MYKKLRQTIDDLKLIDDHGHPGFALYYEGIPKENRVAFAVDTFKTPKETSSGFPYLEQLHYEAYEKFYGFTKEDIDNPEKRNELQIKYDETRRHLSEFMDELMEASGVETFIENYVMPESLQGKKNIKYIPTIDGLVFPFDNTYLKDRVLGKSFIGSYEYELQKWKEKYGYEEKDYNNYVQFAYSVLEGFIKEGVVGFKFSISYARSTYFEKTDPKLGQELYENAREGNIESYNKLQDLLFWTVMRKIAELDMPVQFHFAITDNYVDYFDPLNLANILADEQLKNAKIVILHGGYPRFTNAETLALGGLTPNNVYIDFSGRIMFANHPKIIAKMLRTWLEKPVLWDKLLYGSDTLWGERYLYTCAKTARDAVYFALESMIDDTIIDEETAIVIAKKLLRENSNKLYRL
jgi:predicted TIM-barrel fold metal-dependent hydrolase